MRGCLTPAEIRVFDKLLASGPEGIAKVDLSIHLFGDLGTAESKMNRTAKLVSRIRQKLDRYGYHIQRNPPLKHGVYRLIPEAA
ncbi:hypothetical protein SJ05684_c10340 [Sinorhizobium sojae CCBAU 05684]|uniref:OmpR/PhoB-type domain-containing protein n=1 Tax=Sinorhizobium sojae CCBAU 05684 TaxID=716928 RepID=A0A249P9S3_9HYPH|nr:hypothetical protein SJ05684_c10340 [Sinorhizobium sojae CCBAU 05684]